VRAPLDAILARYGRDITLSHGGSDSVIRGFLQSARQQDKAAPFAVTTLGTVDDRLWLLLTRAELSAEDTVTCGDGTFTVRTAAPVYLGDTVCHWWAALSPLGQAGTTA
jgi:hypothetical protein